MVRIQSMFSYLCGAIGVAAVLLGVVLLCGSMAVGDDPPVEYPPGSCVNTDLRCNIDCQTAPNCPETGQYCDTARSGCDACKCRKVPIGQEFYCTCKL